MYWVQLELARSATASAPGGWIRDVELPTIVFELLEVAFVFVSPVLLDVSVCSEIRSDAEARPLRPYVIFVSVLNVKIKGFATVIGSKCIASIRLVQNVDIGIQDWKPVLPVGV